MYIACSSTLLCTYTCIQIYVISPTTMVCVSRLPTVNGLYRPSYDGGAHIAVLNKSKGQDDITPPLNHWAPDAQC